METIELVNDGTGLGFGIVGGKTTGVIVKTILPGGIADQVIALMHCYFLLGIGTGRLQCFEKSFKHRRPLKDFLFFLVFHDIFSVVENCLLSAVYSESELIASKRRINCHSVFSLVVTVSLWV